LGLNLEQKKAVVAEFSAKIAVAKAVVVAEYRGLEVGSMTELRSEARKSGVYLRVLKNTLARRAVTGTPFEKLGDQLTGPLVYGMSPDPVAAAKVLNEFAKSHDRLVIRAGALSNAVISATEVKALANMPAREVLLAKLLGTMQAPIAQFVRTLNEVPARLARTLAAVCEQKQSAGAS
jgi:large subunit ribosomal protein L10